MVGVVSRPLRPGWVVTGAFQPVGWVMSQLLTSDGVVMGALSPVVWVPVGRRSRPVRALVCRRPARVEVVWWLVLVVVCQRLVWVAVGR
ncbi:hypothetical protein GCM10009827_046280 [Dactylosporangium maewongense]|uniref:Uncharacterized protein n=1 Tax=Dactylosporangium maewongense TaxID=634393 RepID=A0ABP4LIA3_9ACTN